MIPDANDIGRFIRDYFYDELFNYSIYAIFSLAVSIIGIYGSKQVYKGSWKTIAISLLVLVCVFLLMGRKTVGLLSSYEDYSEMSYTVEQNCELYIQEGNNNDLEQKYQVVLTTQSGDVINLRITNDNTFETRVTYKATVIYTNNSKHIVWYHIRPENTGNG